MNTREFKFRAFVEELGGIITSESEDVSFEFSCNGFLLRTRDVRFVDRGGYYTDEIYEWNERPTAILMQYTGLKDKNGVEIYEGDVILMREQPDSQHLIFWDEKRAMYWDKRLEDGDSLAGYLDGNISFVEDGEVVGNIYEHPHLLNA